MQLMTSNKASTSETMTSLELRQLINDSRAENQNDVEFTVKEKRRGRK